jgi:hypothetical protein
MVCTNDSTRRHNAENNIVILRAVRTSNVTYTANKEGCSINACINMLVNSPSSYLVVAIIVTQMRTINSLRVADPLNLNFLKAKDWAIPLHATKVLRGRGNIAPTQRHAPAALYRRGKDPRYPLYKSMCELQSRSGHRGYRKKILLEFCETFNFQR